MIRHVVMWTLKQASDAAHVQQLLQSCLGIVPGMLQFEVGTRQPGLEANCDVVLVSSFASSQALAAYIAHPHHQQVAADIRQRVLSRHVVDHALDASMGPALA